MALTAPRKTITLPESQVTLVLRRLGQPDFAEGGNVPDVLLELGVKQMKGQTIEVEDLRGLDPKALTFTQALAVAAIFKHPPEGRIVYKKPEDCNEAAKEFSFYDLSDTDQDYLVTEAFKMVKEGKASANSFPEKKD